MLWLYFFPILSLLFFFCSRSRDFSLTRESKGRYTRGVLLPKFAQYAPGACSQILNRLNIVSILRGGNSAPEDEVYPWNRWYTRRSFAPGKCPWSMLREQNPSWVPVFNSLSDYRRVRLLSLEPRLFLYCPHSTTLSFRLQFLSFVDHFLLMDPVRGTFDGFGFSPILLSGSSGIAVSSCSVLAVCPRFLISACGDFSFFVSYAYFVLRYLVFALPIVLVLFMQSQYMNLLYLHAFPLGFLRYVLL